MKRLVVLLAGVFLVLSGMMSGLSAQRVPGPGKFLNKDSLAADFTYLVRLLEQTHPDPYTGFGGKVFFKKAAFDLENDFRKNNYTRDRFLQKVTVFLANLQDGHTGVSAPADASSAQEHKLLIGMRTIPGGLIASTLPAVYKEYLGSRIERINGMPVDSLLHEIALRVACENQYGAYAFLSGNSRRKESLLKSVFPYRDSSALFSLVTPSGEKKELEIPLVSVREAGQAQRASLPAHEGIAQGKYMAYSYLDSGKDIMLFRLTSVMARENFKFCLENKWNGAYEQLVDFYRRRLGGKEVPADTARVLAQVPSFSETFLEMLREMKRNKSRVLVVDLRGNGGGWTPITLPSLYMLYGDRYLDAEMDAKFYRLVSPLLLKKQNVSLEEFGKQNGGNFKIGDYTFYDTENETVPDRQVRRKNFIENSLSETRDELYRQNGNPVYEPARIYILTDENTFSAAFHYAYYLWKMGAVVVGVPSRQAPNTYMEQTPFHLPYTGLEGSISNSMQVFLPGKDPRAKTFWPDIMLTYDEYKKYGFDRHSELLYLLDMEKNSLSTQ